MDKALQEGVISGVTAQATNTIGHGGENGGSIYGDDYIKTAFAHD